MTHTVTYAVMRDKGVCAFIDTKDYIDDVSKFKKLTLHLSTDVENALFDSMTQQERKPFNTVGLLLSVSPLGSWGVREPSLEAASGAKSWFCSEMLSCLLGAHGVFKNDEGEEQDDFIPSKTTPGQLHDMLLKAPSCREYDV